MGTIGGESATGAPATQSASLRPACQADASAIAALHANSITEGFLSSLGERFLRRLYRRMMASRQSVVLVAQGPEAVVGFVAGSLQVSKLFSEFVRRDGVLAVLGSPWRLLRSWRKVLETVRHGAAEDSAADGELLAIAVDRQWQGRQLGGSLVQALLEHMASQGAHSVDVVVGADNDPAIAMYRRAGFLPRSRFEFHRGTPSLLLRHGLADSTAPGPAGR